MKNILLISVVFIASCGPNSLLPNLSDLKNECALLQPIVMTIVAAMEAIESEILSVVL